MRCAMNCVSVAEQGDERRSFVYPSQRESEIGVLYGGACGVIEVAV